MKKRWCSKMICLLACMLACSSVAAASESLLKEPQVGAKSAVVIEALTGRVVFWQAADNTMPMASTTKIMTTMLALEEETLDEPFVVDPRAIKVEGSSMGLCQGDTVTLRTLCYGMMLASGNDAANAAAVRCAGSIEAFTEQMNRRAQTIGMKDTVFVTPSGLDAENHHSTAYDMALLMREALKIPDFLEISGSKTVRLEYGNPPYARWLTNHNKLLWNCEGVIAGKTGFTKEAGRCLVSAANRNGVTLICVTLGCPDDWNVHRDLYSRCFDLLQPVELTDLAAGISVPVVGGTGPVELLPEQQLALPLTAGEAAEFQVSVAVQPFLYAPVNAGEWVGELQCRIGSTLFWSCPLVAAQDVPLAFEPLQEKSSLWERLSIWFQKQIG